MKIFKSIRAWLTSMERRYFPGVEEQWTIIEALICVAIITAAIIAIKVLLKRMGG